MGFNLTWPDILAEANLICFELLKSQLKRLQERQRSLTFEVVLSNETGESIYADGGVYTGKVEWGYPVARIHQFVAKKNSWKHTIFTFKAGFR